ncbi:hypothetical protein KCU83_g399, partial [Aureobasidium melanogenum]
MSEENGAWSIPSISNSFARRRTPICLVETGPLLRHCEFCLVEAEYVRSMPLRVYCYYEVYKESPLSSMESSSIYQMLNDPRSFFLSTR